jgi:CBS domain-containing protein
MPISECCNSQVVSCDAETALPDVAALMRKHHVGDVVVAEMRDDKRVAIGIVTDRDIVIETMALGLDAKLFTAGDIMMSPPVTASLGAGFVETLRLMRQHGIRRLPVVDESGALAGIVTADDIVRMLSLELSLLTGAIASEQRQERRLRRSP